MNGTHLVGGVPDWTSVFGRTLAGSNGLPDQVLVLDGDQSQEWSVGELLDQPRRKVEPGRLGHTRDDSDIDTVTGVDEGVDIGGNERLLLQIPDSALS